MKEERVLYVSLFKIIMFFLLILLLVVLWGRFTGSALKATHAHDATLVYEEFEEIYQTCQRVNTDLCNLRAADPGDEMFRQISKQQRILSLKGQLTKLITDYNAKSRMWGRSLWKSKQLPYQLVLDQFSCYSETPLSTPSTTTTPL